MTTPTEAAQLALAAHLVEAGHLEAAVHDLFIALSAAGYDVLPTEPTDAMVNAFTAPGTATFRQRYAAMRAASPQVSP